MPWYDDLQALLRKADFDSAAQLLSQEKLETWLVRLPANALDSLRARCLICEVLDYSGLYKDGVKVIESSGKAAIRTLMALRAERTWAPYSEEDLQMFKQQCWAVMHVAIVLYYRKHDYKRARNLFRLSEQVLSRLQEKLTSVGSSAYGSLARANYCLGLVARQEHLYDQAREYFSRSVEHGWKGLSNANGETLDAFNYNIGRVLGLGLAWVAYTRAALWDANAYIVAARLLLRNKPVKYIHAYIEIVHACTMMAAHADSLSELNEGMQILKRSYAALGGEEALRDRSKGHAVYTLRAACELALGHFRLGRLHGKRGEGQKLKQEEFARALECVALVKAYKDTKKIEKRTYCKALIIESRVLREQGGEMRKRAALKAALQAWRIGSTMGFSSIDCWITLGEAQFDNGKITDAIHSFVNARDDKRAKTNPKVLAVCNLHLARCYLAQGKLSLAQERVSLWEEAGCPGNQNAFIRELGDIVKQEFESELTSLIISPKGPLSAKYWLDVVRCWLAHAALSRAGGDEEEAAKLLEKSVKALQTWQKLKPTNRDTT